MNIVYAGNASVFDGLFISLISLIKHNHMAITVYVLTMDLTEIDEQYQPISEKEIQLIEAELHRVNKASQIIRVDTKDIFLKRLGRSKNLFNRYTPYALLRLLLDDIPSIPNKVLYLDTDTIINASLDQLYNLNIKNVEYAASRDRYGRFFFYPNYINTGVLLLNLTMIRQTGLFKKVVNLLNTKKVFLSDQTGINKMTKFKMIIGRQYNEQKSVRNDTIIRHFSMQFGLWPKFHFINIKPWHVERLHSVYHCHEFDDIITQYLTMKTNKENQIS